MVRTVGVSAACFSWLRRGVVDGGGPAVGVCVVVLLGSSSSFATSPCPSSDFAVVSESREACVVVM